MRKLPAATIVSMICHCAALGWLVGDGKLSAAPRRVDPTSAVLPDPPATRESIAIVLLEDDRDPVPASQTHRIASTASEANRRAPPGGPPPRSAHAGNQGQPESQAAISTGATSGREHGGEPARSRWMTMRGPERPQLEPSSEFLADFLARSKPVPPPPDIPGERLANEIADLRKRLRRAGPGQADGLLIQIVALNEQLAAEELKPAGGGTYKADKEAFTAKVDRDGSVELKDKTGSLDWQDRMMLRNGTDPYARNKLAMLDRTRDQRVALGERHRSAELARSTELMQETIDRLWILATDLAARKAGLFELWDDCAETGDDAVVAAGAAARALVVGVIRARLRGDSAYTAAELAELNARRRSTIIFAPYDSE